MAKANLDRKDMPRQSPEARAKNFEEVALGYTPDLTAFEASRCLNCPKKYCIGGCPVGIDIPAFIMALRENDLPRAARVLKEKNALPGVCGRVCPQETQCEAVCLLAKQKAPIAIGRLERYVADWERDHPSSEKTVIAPPSGKKVAVVGSGPAGLTCAAEMARLGHKVTMFEALHVAGGVLMYGIPEFRLPKDIVQGEVEYVRSLGVELELNAVVGKIDNVDELLSQGYDAVFLGTGAGLPLFLRVPGENLSGVYSANEFLTRVNLMKAYRFPEFDTPVKIGKKVAVIGGGNVAMDAARCALRLGADEVSIVYRRSEVELPARREEVENAKEEGIKFRFLTNPTKFLGDAKHQLLGMECIEMELGEPDASGRHRPIPKPDSAFTMDCDVAVVALGTTPNPLIAQTTSGLHVSHHGTVVASEATGRTNKAGVWAGGDVVTGSATVISAMGAAKRAAADMDRYLRGVEQTPA
ncbi:MAG: NADPH-dependent glutamate synthase [Dehalococcoidia bacterium]|nr:MAG: NADPH-dependent glutamate synthase [Dehalococcoidia bacterium]